MTSEANLLLRVDGMAVCIPINGPYMWNDSVHDNLEVDFIWSWEMCLAQSKRAHVLMAGTALAGMKRADKLTQTRTRPHRTTHAKGAAGN